MENNPHLVILTGKGLQKCKVSSVLNKTAEFSGNNMFDYDTDSCWNSDQGSPQYFIIDFLKPVHVSQVAFLFQGGFVGRQCSIAVGMQLDNLEIISTIDPVDDNSLQTFQLNREESLPQAISESFFTCRYLQVIFPESTDFYGRVTIYKFQVSQA